METKLGSHPQRRLYDQLGSSTGLRLPSLQPDIQDPREGNHRPNGTDSSRSSSAGPALVAGSVKTSNISASVASEQSNPLYGPHRSEQSPSNVSSPSLGRVSHLYQRFQAEGVPTILADLLIVATPHTKPTSLAGTVGAAGVLDGKLIPFRHLQMTF